MIKINLLGQRKVRRGRPSAGAPPPVLLFTILGMVAAAAATFLFIHMPLAGDVDDTTKKNADLTSANAALKKKTKNSRQIRAAFESELARQVATQRLKRARVTPAWLMHELSNILTPGKQPQLTPDMQTELKDNPNRAWQDGWDPKHVWITEFSEKDGKFSLKGGAQSRGDVDEIGLRMTASMFFNDVTPTETDDVSDKDTGLTYHKFTIEGKVRY